MNPVSYLSVPARALASDTHVIHVFIFYNFAFDFFSDGWCIIMVDGLMKDQQLLITIEIVVRGGTIGLQ